MWSIYIKKNTFTETIPYVNLWKDDIFTKLKDSMLKYYASKVSTYFDNAILFQSKHNHHDLLMGALASSEVDMLNIKMLYPDVLFYVIEELDNTSIITQNLSVESSYMPNKDYGILVYDLNINLEQSKIVNLKFNSWSTLVFSPELVDYSNSWISYVPSLEERALLQAKNIITSANFKKHNLTLLEKIKFDENIENYPQFEELYLKLLKVMPKMDHQLHEEVDLNQNSQIVNKRIKTKL